MTELFACLAMFCAPAGSISSELLKCLQNLGSFTDGSVLPTFLEGTNVTIATETVNGTETVMVDSYGAETTIVTPAAFACDVSLL